MNLKKITMAVATLATAISLTGCDSYLRDRDDSFGPTNLPDGCHALYKHVAGDDGESDEYAGIYCRTEIPVPNPEEPK